MNTESSNEFDENLKQLLEPGEIILWRGQSDSDKAFYSFGALITAVFGLGWTVFAANFLSAAWNRPVSSNGNDALVLMIAILITLIGILMVIAPYLYQRSAQNTLYVITKRRLLAVKRMKWTSTAYVLDDIKSVEYRDHDDGTTTVKLETHRIGGAGSPARAGYTFLRGLRNIGSVKAILGR